MSALVLDLRFGVELRARGASSLMERVGCVLAVLLEAGLSPTVLQIREACYRAGVRSPTHGANGRVSYGTVDRVLRVLRAAGALEWASAYVHRWHFAERPQPGQARVRWTGKVWRLPARIVALGASWIERHQAPAAGSEATQSASADGRAVVVSSQPIQVAPEATPSEIRPRLVIPDELQQRLGIRKAKA